MTSNCPLRKEGPYIYALAYAALRKIDDLGKIYDLGSKAMGNPVVENKGPTGTSSVRKLAMRTPISEKSSLAMMTYE